MQRGGMNLNQRFIGPTPASRWLAVLTILIVGVTAQSQTVFVVDQFNPTGAVGNNYASGQITNVWTNWFGNAFQSLAWDPASDASNNPASGSLKITADFNGAKATSNQFEVYDGLHGVIPTLSGLQYTNFQCDVRFAPNSATVTAYGQSIFGHLEFGVVTSGYGQDYFGGIDVPAGNPNWVHVSLPLNAVADTNLLGINDVLIHMYGSYYGTPGLSGPTVLWVDNIQFTGATLPATNCVVDWHEVHQRIDGFGASSAWNGNWTTAQADMFFSTNSGIGLSLLRSRIAPDGSTVETGIMKLAQARGARVWSTPWSPPAIYKSTNSVNGGSFVASPAHYQGYANQLAGYVTAMKNQYGINIYGVSIQNEPNYATTYESCLWTAQQFHDFIPYLATALTNHGVGTTQILLAETSYWNFDLTTSAMNDAATAGHVDILAAHNYGSTAAPVNNQGKPLWETEDSTFDPFDGSITNAMYWAGQIHAFLTVAQVNAWHFWWLIPAGSDNEGLTDVSGNPTKRMYVLGNYSRFVRPGYYRIGVANNAYTSVSAYKDANSGSFAIVAINSGFSPVTQTFNLANFDAGSVTPWLTSGSASLAKQPVIKVTNSVFTYPLPPLSVVTFVGQAFVAPFNISVMPGPVNRSALVLHWNSVAGASYSVLKTNRLSGIETNWPVLQTGYPAGGAAGGSLSYTDATVNASPAYFRLRSP